ncbi:MAG: chemotaxis response regulator protein-glutamate methylesterase [Nitriliruptoraceae bacterium]|nr:chemotaxis response regulator protein-glutamate methylesterase [Nitriliruptoraceae bacterium]
MPRPRVLVVDDAVVVRRIVTDVLKEDPNLEVVGTASNGRIALQKIPQLNPDIVTLDVEMPEMNGLETLVELRKRYPRLPVIMFSTLTDRGTSATMEALLKGANDYVTKPANVGSVTEAMARVREQLVPKVHALCGTAPSAAPGAPAQPARRVPTPTPAPPRPRARPSTPVVQAVVIGVSTGGPNALAEVIPALPASLGVPVFIVQHMPPMFTKLLAERLDGHSPLTISEAVDGEVVRPNHVYIAPGDFHLEVVRRGVEVVTRTTKGPLENSCRPAADVLFRTATAIYGAGTLCAVLTGMGADGRRGAEHVHEAGGHVIAQDQATSVVWGMPGAVAAAGLADELVPLDQVASRLSALVAASNRTPQGVHR